MVQSAVKSRKIGLLGGTFDPVHNGHLAVATHVRLTLGLDQVIFIPAALPPHKDAHADGQAITGFHHRVAMLKMATAENSTFTVSDIEGQRSVPSYSIDTVKILKEQLEDSAKLFFIIGVDAFLEIETWKNFTDLPSLVSFAIISRPDYPAETVGDLISRSFTGFRYEPGAGSWISRMTEESFILMHMDPVPVSSTGVREMLTKGQDVSGLVPPEVAEYIRKNRLYSI